MPGSLDRAVAALRAGKLIVYPTDTLFGLGANARDARAVQCLLDAKRRPGGQPISVAVSSVEEVEPLALLTARCRAYLRRNLPGPYTVLLPASPTASKVLAPTIFGSSTMIGIRVPDHPVARELARRVGVITATSANRHGESPVTNLVTARRVFGDEVGVYVSAGPTPSGRPSSIVDLRRDEPRVVMRT